MKTVTWIKLLITIFGNVAYLVALVASFLFLAAFASKVTKAVTFVTLGI